MTNHSTHLHGRSVLVLALEELRQDLVVPAPPGLLQVTVGIDGDAELVPADGGEKGREVLVGEGGGDGAAAEHYAAVQGQAVVLDGNGGHWKKMNTLRIYGKKKIFFPIPSNFGR